MTYHVTFGQKLRELVPDDMSSISVRSVKDHFVSNITSIPLKSRFLIINLNDAFIESDLWKNQEYIDAAAKQIKRHLSCTDEEAYSHCIKYEKAMKTRLSGICSSTRGTIVETTMSEFYGETHIQYGIVSQNGFWEFLPKNEYIKRMQFKDQMKLDKTTMRMITRDPTNLTLQQIRSLVKQLT